MFSLIKQVFIVLLSFTSSLAHVAKVSHWTKCASLNDEPCMLRLTLMDLNTAELKYYPLTISLDNVVEVVMSHHQKYVFQRKRKKKKKC